MSDFVDVARAVDDLKDDIEDNIEAALESSFDDVIRQMQYELKKDNTIATRELIESLDDVAQVTPGDLVAARAIVGAPYWKFVEFGTGIYTSPKRGYSAAGIPPFVPIYRWVVAKGITPRPDTNYTTQAEVAGAIQHSMSEGTPQQPFARPAWRGRRGKRHVQQSIENAISRAIMGAL